jgi:hypothetical protein
MKYFLIANIIFIVACAGVDVDKSTQAELPRWQCGGSVKLQYKTATDATTIFLENNGSLRAKGEVAVSYKSGNSGVDRKFEFDLLGGESRVLSHWKHNQSPKVRYVHCRFIN